MQYSKAIYEEIVKVGWVHFVTIKGWRLVVITRSGVEVEIWNDFCAVREDRLYAVAYALAQASISIYRTVLG